MNDKDIELSARFAAYERVLEFLLTKELCRRSPDRWQEMRAGLIGEGQHLSNGLMSVEDLQRLGEATAERIDMIFDRAQRWATRAMEE